MNWLQKLAALLGVDVATLTGEDVDITAVVAAHAAQVEDLAGFHTAVKELFIELRAVSEAAGIDTVEAAQADALAARNLVVVVSGEQTRRNTIVEAAQALADSDELELPAPVAAAPVVEPVVETTPVADAAPVEDAPATPAPDQVDVTPELVAATDVPVFFLQASNYSGPEGIVPIAAGVGSANDIGRVLAAHAAASTKGAVIEAPYQINTNAALAESDLLAAACGDASIGSCQFPVIDTAVTDCFDNTFTSAVITEPFANTTGRRVGQALERRRPSALDEGGFFWNQASYANLFASPGVLKTGAALDAALKQCRTWECVGTVSVKPVKVGDCVSCYPNDADPEILDQKRREIDANIVRNTATALHDFIFANADWRTFANTEGSNAWASLTELFGAVAGRNYFGKQLANPGFWVLGPSWLMAFLEQENPLRSTAAPAGEWTELLASLGRMGGTYVGASQGFSPTNAGLLTASGTSTWTEGLTGAVGTYAAQTALAPLPNTLPLFFIPKGGVKMEAQPFIRYGYEADNMPLDTTEQRGNCLSLFGENEVMFDLDNCRPIIGIELCVDPQAVGRAAAAAVPAC